MTNIYEIVPLAEHRSNLDRSAKLVSPAAYTGRDIYQVRGGFLACMDDGLALAGLFPSIQEAMLAQSIAAGKGAA